MGFCDLVLRLTVRNGWRTPVTTAPLALGKHTARPKRHAGFLRHASVWHEHVQREPDRNSNTVLRLAPAQKESGPEPV